jgi:rsbT co-antagonist protein RsbR
VQLLGAQVMITGIQPAMAQTLAQLGVNLGNIVTRHTLQAGIAYALQEGNEFGLKKPGIH